MYLYQPSNSDRRQAVSIVTQIPILPHLSHTDWERERPYRVVKVDTVGVGVMLLLFYIISEGYNLAALSYVPYAGAVLVQACMICFGSHSWISEIPLTTKCIFELDGLELPV